MTETTNKTYETYYQELFNDSFWGENYVMLNNDDNLLRNTNFNDSGFSMIDIDKNISDYLTQFVKSHVYSITNKNIDLHDYHNMLSENEHNQIIHAMPFNKTSDKSIEKLCIELENKVSSVLNEDVKIFNDDLWVRICRPTHLFKNDFNPCHRDVYLDFYRNTVNIYLPICGSNEKSSLTLQPGSHKWFESETRTTKGGAFFKSTQKKYSVDAIVSSKTPLTMIRPNPSVRQLMIFSPYLIHGCASNDNLDITRFSLEVRFIKNDDKGREQETKFNEFFKTRTWR